MLKKLLNIRVKLLARITTISLFRIIKAIILMSKEFCMELYVVCLEFECLQAKLILNLSVISQADHPQVSCVFACAGRFKRLFTKLLSAEGR